MRTKRHKEAEVAIKHAALGAPVQRRSLQGPGRRIAEPTAPYVRDGSQNETEKLGVTLGGLDPNRDYQRFCFVRRVPTE